jgi:concanavalin A-like lectin/glucanase superfamily protein
MRDPTKRTMKRLRSNSDNSSFAKAAGTISAAALMLGVSHAATVGFNFQCNYCGAASYSGAIVTAPAFGIGTNGWESLAQMETGYGCPDPAAYFTLTNVVDSTTLAGTGLNPLPNGSVTVVWSAYTANVSGFGGYTRSAPHYIFGGNGYKPGNEQVYWGFLRDGVNFGPGSSGGDNNQPGYSIDIAGLKSLFTNSPFVIELVASTDSMQYLTNAFVIDATASATQSVVYPSTPTVAYAGGTTWMRGIGGGLSTSSANLDTDHVLIIGNRAAHAGDQVTGYNFASTIAGFIVTDQPVVTMSPNSVLASPADTLVLSAYAIGVPPVAYQWRQDGVPISGATSLSYGITNVGLAAAGNYDLVASNAYGMATSSVATVTVDLISVASGDNFVIDSNPNNPEHDGTESGSTWAASNTDSNNATRNGVMKFVPNNPSQIVVPAGSNLNTTNGTIMFWVRTLGLSDPSGHDAILFDRRGGSGLVIAMDNTGTLLVQGSSSAFPDINSVVTIADDTWHHVALTFDQGMGGAVTLFVNGSPNSASTVASDWAWQVGQEIELGLSHDTFWQPLQGFMDDVRIYNRILTPTEIQTAASSDALVDTGALVLRLNFDAPPTAGATLSWQCPDAVLQSADLINGPYTDVPSSGSPYSTAAQQSKKFYRYRGHVPVTLITNPYLM